MFTLGKSTETENRLVAPVDEGKRDKKSLLMDMGVSFIRNNIV